MSEQQPPWWEGSAGAAGGVNRSGAEMSPRRGAPMGHGVHSIARIQPMVPELSMFFPSSTSRVSFCEENLRTTTATTTTDKPRQPLAPVSENVPHTISAAPLKSDFSADTQTFERLERAVVVSVQQQQPPPPPHAVYEVLSKQDEQIRRLQEQVERLLSERNNGSRTEETGTSPAPPIVNNSSSCSNLADSSTQTSAPPSPRKKESAAPTREEEKGAPNEFSPKNVHDDSLELGESATMYGREKARKKPGSDRNIISEPSEADEEEECGELLDQIQRALHGGPEEKKKGSETDKSLDVASATFQRLRQMGVSFLSPEDIGKKAGTERHQTPTYDDTLYRPRAADPSSSSSTVGAQSFTTDSSLAINSAALKYLDDQQLAHLAIKQKEEKAKRNPAYGRVPVSEPGLSRFGLPDTQLSMATRQFLEGNRFAAGGQNRFEPVQNRFEPAPPKREGIVKNMTQLLNQPKFT